MPAPKQLTFAEAIAAESAAALAVVQATVALQVAEEGVEVARENQRLAYAAMREAEARDSVGSIPLGTRVRHYYFTENLGTVVEGVAGLAVRQDLTDKVTDGYAAGEWIPVEDDEAAEAIARDTSGLAPRDSFSYGR